MTRWFLPFTFLVAVLCNIAAPSGVALHGATQDAPAPEFGSVSDERRIFVALSAALPQAHAEFLLNNNSPRETTVVPVYYDRGRAIAASPIVLTPNALRWVKLREITSQNVDGIEFRYRGEMQRVVGQGTIQLPSLRGSADLMYSGPADYATPVQEAVWWAPPGSRAVMMITNVTAAPVVVHVDEPRRERRPVRLSPYSTRLMVQEPHGGDDVGWIRLEIDGDPDAVRAGGFVEAPRRLSGIVRFYDPGGTEQQHLYATNVRVRRTQAHLTLKNTSPIAASAVIRVSPMTDQEPESIELPAVQLDPHTAMHIDLTSALRDMGADLTFERVSLQVINSGTPGSLIGAMAFLNQDTGLTSDVPLRDSGPVRRSTGTYPWRLDRDFSTVVSITNVGDVPAWFLARITHAAGVYWLPPKQLPAGASATYDLRAIRDQQTPDRDGQVLPANVTQGQFRWSVQKARGSEQARLNGRSELISLTGQTSRSYSCGQCCPSSYNFGAVVPYSFMTPQGLSTRFTILDQRKDCYGNPDGYMWAYPTSWDVGNWSVTAARTITWGEGEADGISPGSSWITGNWTSTIFVPEQENCTEFWVPASGSGETEVQCAVPTNFRKVGDAEDLGFGRIRFTYMWDSSTGTRSALSGCEIGEVVTYPQMPFPSPFPAIDVPNPTTLEVNGAEPNMKDLHETNGAFRTPYSTKDFVAQQIFRYRCQCNGNQWNTLMGPHDIKRSVFQEGGTWKFRITKHGESVTINLP